MLATDTEATTTSTIVTVAMSTPTSVTASTQTSTICDVAIQTSAVLVATSRRRKKKIQLESIVKKGEDEEQGEVISGIEQGEDEEQSEEEGEGPSKAK
ncbi:hypothetical protein AV530_014215 [Patagioenas fasciata monilis]|uniref:Uncharacterized protein n=1 Tax=Patagioenas fasciata monilis TaxID=372326 RepID=A0A1V4KYB5_PATFA|nr:hypothetical protein AV530_014215 [Patagioenas fasciata monilis]